MSTIGKRFLNPQAIEAAIKECFAMSAGYRIALAGGVAMQLYGSDRFTTDVDFIASGIPGSFRIKKLLSFGGVTGATSAGTPVCLIVRNDDFRALYKDALANTSMAPDGFPMVSAEHMAAMKMVAGRTKDLLDLKFLLMNRVCDLDRTRDIVKKFLGAYALKEFNAHVDEADWCKRRDANLARKPR